MKIVISGYREFNDEKVIEKELLKLVKEEKNITLVHGGCRGVDAIGERIAKKHGWNVKIFPASWALGLSAGPIRNQKMIDDKPDVALLFLSQKSRGTLDMLKRVQKANISCVVVYID